MCVKTQAQLKKELDRIFSIYIRMKYADSNGNTRCYTCSKSGPWKSLQNGHWIPRNILITRFSEENCRPQCVGCNMFNKGKPDVFAINLLKEGVDIIKMGQSRYQTLKVDTIWYESKIKHYKERVKELEGN